MNEWSISKKAQIWATRVSHNSRTHTHALKSDSLCHVICLVVWLLTGNLKEIGEKDDGLCSFAPVWPEPKKRAREQPAQTEGGQTQTQEVRRGLQNLQISPYRGQNDGWDRQRGMKEDEGKEGDV